MVLRVAQKEECLIALMLHRAINEFLEKCFITKPLKVCFQPFVNDKLKESLPWETSAVGFFIKQFNVLSREIDLKTLVCKRLYTLSFEAFP